MIITFVTSVENEFKMIHNVLSMFCWRFCDWTLMVAWISGSILGALVDIKFICRTSIGYLLMYEQTSVDHRPVSISLGLDLRY